MKILGKFEVYQIFEIKIGIALAGKFISGKPISNQKDILKKNILFSCLCDEKNISVRVISIEGRFGRIGQDIVIEENDNAVLIVETEQHTQILNEVKLTSTIIGEIIEK